MDGDMYGEHQHRLDTLREAMTVGSRANRHALRRARDHGQVVKLFRNIYINPRALEGADQWEVRLKVALARLIAVSMALGSHCPLVRESATFLHGVNTDRDNGEVHVRVPRGRRWNLWSLEELRISGNVIPKGRVVRHELTLPEGVVEHPIPDVSTVALPVAAVQAAQATPARKGVVIASGALRELAGFRNYDQDSSRARERHWREELNQWVELLPNKWGRPRARAVIAAADAGCESVAERILLWILKAAGFKGVDTQVEHVVNSRTYYTDIEVENGAGIVEYDGKGKYGRSVEEVLTSLTERDQRQKDLEAEGLLVLRFEGFELKNPMKVTDEIRNRTGARRRRPVRLLAT